MPPYRGTSSLTFSKKRLLVKKTGLFKTFTTQPLFLLFVAIIVSGCNY